MVVPQSFFENIKQNEPQVNLIEIPRSFLNEVNQAKMQTAIDFLNKLFPEDIRASTDNPLNNLSDDNVEDQLKAIAQFAMSNFFSSFNQYNVGGGMTNNWFYDTLNMPDLSRLSLNFTTINQFPTPNIFSSTALTNAFNARDGTRATENQPAILGSRDLRNEARSNLRQFERNLRNEARNNFDLSGFVNPYERGTNEAIFAEMRARQDAYNNLFDDSEEGRERRAQQDALKEELARLNDQVRRDTQLIREQQAAIRAENRRLRDEGWNQIRDAMSPQQIRQTNENVNKVFSQVGDWIARGEKPTALEWVELSTNILMPGVFDSVMGVYNSIMALGDKEMWQAKGNWIKSGGIDFSKAVKNSIFIPFFVYSTVDIRNSFGEKLVDDNGHGLKTPWEYRFSEALDEEGNPPRIVSWQSHEGQDGEDTFPIGMMSGDFGTVLRDLSGVQTGTNLWYPYQAKPTGVNDPARKMMTRFFLARNMKPGKGNDRANRSGPIIAGDDKIGDMSVVKYSTGSDDPNSSEGFFSQGATGGKRLSAYNANVLKLVQNAMLRHNDPIRMVAANITRTNTLPRQDRTGGPHPTTPESSNTSLEISMYRTMPRTTDDGVKSALAKYSKNQTQTFTNHAIWNMLNAGPDAFSNMFDAYLIFNSLNNTNLIFPQNITPNSIEKVLLKSPVFGVRFKTMEIPFPKQSSFNSNFIMKTISRKGSMVELEKQGAFNIIMDENLYFLDYFNNFAGHKMRKDSDTSENRKKFAFSELSKVWNSIINIRNNPYNIQEPQISLIIRGTLLHEYGSIMMKSRTGTVDHSKNFTTPDSNTLANNFVFDNSIRNLQNTLPIFYFEHLKFLGSSNSIEFNQESAETQDFTFNFVYRRMKPIFPNKSLENQKNTLNDKIEITKNHNGLKENYNDTIPKDEDNDAGGTT